jgi:DNA polymerase-3 subunit gamma/tau
MTYLALARKYRPTRFADLAAQAHVAAGLGGAVAKNRVAHAYLLTGPRGVGKTSAARILAMALNCERREEAGGEEAGGKGEPCGHCDSCKRIWSGAANLDVVEIDAASNRGVDDARDLRERATYAASGPDRHKVYIIDEAHMLTREAWNALLKILEEPPPRVVFVFATTEPQKIANTAAPVMSRLQRFDFRRLGPHTIVERLRYVAEHEAIDVENDALLLMARVAHGGMRDALSLLDQTLAFGEGAVTAARVRDVLGLISDELYVELLDLVADRRQHDVFPFVARLVDAGADLVEFVGGAGETVRALLVRVLGGQPEGITETLRSAIDQQASRYTPGDLLRMLKLLGDVETAIRRSPHSRLHVELLLLQWAMLDRTVELAEVLNALRAGAPPTVPEPVSPAPKAAAPRVAAPAQLAAAPDSTPRLPVPLTPEGLASAWPAVVSEVGRRRRMVRESLAQARPVAVEGDRVTLHVTKGEAHLEGLERNRRAVQEAIQTVTGHRVALVFGSAGDAAGPAANATDIEPKRLHEDTDRAERLRMYRSKDPTLDAAVDALDLELLE